VLGRVSKNFQVALQFPLSQCRVLVTDMLNDGIAPTHVRSDLSESGQDLFVDSEAPPHLRVIAEQGP
jgi:hypothetical protein